MRKRAFLRPRTVAEFLGVDVQTVYRWVQEGKLEAVKCGPEGTKAAVCIPWKALVRFIGDHYGASQIPAPLRRNLADLLEVLASRSRDPALAESLRLLSTTLRQHRL